MAHIKKEKKPVVTLDRITALLRGQPDKNWSRLEICRALGHEKTSYMIRQIDQAAYEGLIFRYRIYDEKYQRDVYLYNWADILYTEEFGEAETETNPVHEVDRYRYEDDLERSRVERIEWGV